ncbi:MAG: LicD family protein [Bacteroidales bacterium]|jgi:lipopolysaccharide cholinephosphotransferase|nr:LicD family protein [Bacteroidota bacterium]NLN98927.1 LicD family protein [Bacteroidales bacterium]
MHPIDRRQIQLTLLEILKDVDAFCRASGIRYSLAYGTLLGAVRHKGFIPWDDDIDLLMPRPDFERFLATYGKEPGARYQCLFNARGKKINFVNFFAKVHDTKTLSIESRMRKSHRFGLSIDLFPVDGKPDDRKALLRHEKRLGHCAHQILLKQRPFFPLSFHNPLPAMIEAHLHSLDGLLRRCMKLMKEYDFSTSRLCGSAPIGSNGLKEVYERELFEEYIELEFEGCRFLAFSRWDEYLRQQFGDYMQLPPENQRKSHGLTVYLLDEPMRMD